MSEWKKGVGAIVLFVEDLDRSKAFYREVFALPAQAEDASVSCGSRPRAAP